MKCIIFDFDETIFPSKNTAKKAMDRVIRELNLGKYNINILNKPLYSPQVLIKLISVENGLSDENEIQLLELYKKHLAEEEKKANIDNTIYRILNNIDSKKFFLAIYSERSTEGLVSLLEQKGIYNKFGIICGRDVLQPKPSTEFISCLVDNYNIKIDDMIYIGDTDVDYLTAKASGVYYIHAKYSMELSNLSWKFCDKMVESPNELKDVIQNFLSYGVKNESGLD